MSPVSPWKVLLLPALMASVIAALLTRGSPPLATAAPRSDHSSAATVHATQAMELARQHAGDRSLAEIYWLNAVNHAPDRIDVLREYARFVLTEGTTPSPGEQDRLAAALNVAAYNIEPAAVPEVLDWSQQVQKARMVDVGTAAPVVSPVSPQEQQRKREADACNLTAVTRLLEESRLLRDEAADETRGDWETEIRLTADHVAALGHAIYIDRCLDRLKAETDLTNRRAAAVVQAAESTLPSFWGVDPSALPPQLREKIDAYPQVIDGWVQRIAEARSDVVLAGMRKSRDLAIEREPAVNATDIHPNRSRQERTNHWEKCFRDLQQQAGGVSWPGKLPEAQAIVEEVQSRLLASRRFQMNAYQRFAVSRIAEAYRGFNGEWIVREGKAVGFIQQHGLHKLDPALLSPDVSRAYNDVLSRLLAELSANTLVDVYELLSSTIKYKLEDF